MNESPHTGDEGAEVYCWDGDYHRWHTNHRIAPLAAGDSILYITWYCSICRRVELRMSPVPIPIDERMPA